jgi:DNA polymerase-3 subunit epsilon
MTIAAWNPGQTPYAVVDVETTGLTPAFDRIVEITVVHLDPEMVPRVAYDSLIDPRRRVTGTDIHGITDADVQGAPTFADALGDVARALAGRVVVGHNISFDLRFINAEMASAGLGAEMPYMCTMYLQPCLGLGKRSTLEAACTSVGLTRTQAHFAAGDAVDTARLLHAYLRHMRTSGIGSFAELKKRGKYKFAESFTTAPLQASAVMDRPASLRKTRTTAAVVARDVRMRTYYQALVAALFDLDVTDDEAHELEMLREQLRLTTEDVRALHAHIFAGAILMFVSDQHLEEGERRYLATLRGALSRLGWAPGE